MEAMRQKLYSFFGFSNCLGNHLLLNRLHYNYAIQIGKMFIFYEQFLKCWSSSKWRLQTIDISICLPEIGYGDNA